MDAEEYAALYRTVQGIEAHMARLAGAPARRPEDKRTLGELRADLQALLARMQQEDTGRP